MKSKIKIKNRIKNYQEELDKIQGVYYHNRRRIIHQKLEELNWVLED